MLVKYLIFCFGAGLVQGAYIRQPGPGGVSILDTPLWFSSTAAKIIVPIIAIGLFIAEVALGFALIAWWAGVFLWLPALIITSMFIPGSLIVSRNPAMPFLVGILIVIGAAISFLI